MAASVRPIKARLGAARLLLEGMRVRPTSEEYRLASATQRIAVVAAINEHNALHAEERADLSAMALKVPWAEEDKLMILSKLVQEEPEKMQRTRREQQDFESCPWYFTADEWEVLLDASVPQIVKRDSLVRRCVALGLRCPTETTKKLIASMWMIVSEPHKPNLLKLTPSSKVAIKKDVSKAFEGARKKLPPPAVYLAKLPARPQDLKRERPDFFATAYPSGEPVESKLDYAFLREFDNSYSCRGEGASGSCHSGAVASVGQDPTQIMQTMLQQMLMQGMNMMQQQQQGDLIQIMGGQGRSSTTSPRALGNLLGNLASIATPTGRFRRAASAPALPLAADDEAAEEEAADEATEEQAEQEAADEATEEQAVLAVEDAPKTPKTLKTPEDAPKTTEDAPKTTKAASQAAMARDNVLALSHERTERKKEEKKDAAKKGKEARKEAAQKEKEAKKVAASKEKEAKTEAAEKQRKAAETKASEGEAKPKKRKVAETKASEGEATEEDKAATKASEGEAKPKKRKVAETKASEGEAEKVAETKASEGEAKPKKRGP